jgi:hypothetical protein
MCRVTLGDLIDMHAKYCFSMVAVAEVCGKELVHYEWTGTNECDEHGESIGEDFLPFAMQVMDSCKCSHSQSLMWVLSYRY